MKKLKMFLLLIIVFLVCGCSGTYNLKINNDLSVSEELNITLEDESSNYDSINDLFINNNIDEKDYRIVIENNDLNVTYNNKYDSIEDYLLNSFLYKQLFDNISYNTDRKEFSLEASNIFNNNNSTLNFSNRIKSLQIKVDTPLNVVEENSDSSTDNSYIWSIDNKTKEKDLYLIFSVDNNIFTTGNILVFGAIIIVLIILVYLLIKRLLSSRKI